MIDNAKNPATSTSGLMNGRPAEAGNNTLFSEFSAKFQKFLQKLNYNLISVIFGAAVAIILLSIIAIIILVYTLCSRRNRKGDYSMPPEQKSDEESVEPRKTTGLIFYLSGIILKIKLNNRKMLNSFSPRK